MHQKYLIEAVVRRQRHGMQCSFDKDDGTNQTRPCGWIARGADLSHYATESHRVFQVDKQ